MTLTEDDLFNRLFPRIGPLPEDVVLGPGDDCAAIRAGAGRLLLVAVDQIVGGRHYLEKGPDAAAPEDVGRKLLARNLSDIAAMGGVPRFAVTALARKPQCDEEWMQRFYDGIIGAGRLYGVSMIGGDLASTEHELVAALTIIGEVEDGRLCTRSNVRPGDMLYATGSFGASFETGWHLHFEPRCAEGHWLATNGFTRAMIDVSDGLLLDALRLCRASDVVLELNLDSIPRRVPDLEMGRVLSDGEDYELLIAVSPDVADRLETEWPFPAVPLTRIGRFVETQAGTSDAERVRDVHGRTVGECTGGVTGYDHLSGHRRLTDGDQSVS